MSMSKEAKLADLMQKREVVLGGGGAEKTDKLHADGKLTARERVLALLDEGSFVELDQFVAHRGLEFGTFNQDTPSEGVITGYGTVSGRLIYLFSQDATVLGGSLGEAHAGKICKIMDMAVKAGAPLVGMYDSGGARVQEGIDALNGYGEIFKRHAQASGIIPQISLIMGSCMGAAAYAAALTDFVLMVENNSQMFITGPQVLKAVTGHDMTAEDLGGAAVHNAKSGNAHFQAANDLDCLAQAKSLLSFMPDNNLSGTTISDIYDQAERTDAMLAGIVPEDPNEVYDMRKVITSVADNNQYFEVQAAWAQNISVGFIRLNGVSVGVVANQPLVYGGSLDMDAADKAAHFISVCDSFGIPVLTFVDTPGYLPSLEQEAAGLIRHGAKLFHAYAEATVLKMTLVVGKAYGSAYLSMCPKALGADTVLAWPTAQISIMSAEAAANVLYAKEIAEAGNPPMMRQEMISHYQDEMATPFCAASRGLVDLIIKPEETRYYLIKTLDSLLTKMEVRPGKKHSNFPS